jgi:hypothetical protein
MSQKPFHVTACSLRTAFGEANVTYMKVLDVYDEIMVSVVYPSDKKRRLEFSWKDEEARKMPGSIRVRSEHSTWKTNSGIGIGTPLEEVLEQNGKAISILGFGHEVSGKVVDYGGGTLTRLPGGCTLDLYFALGPKLPNPNFDKVTSESAFSSDDPNMRALKLEVMSISIDW